MGEVGCWDEGGPVGSCAGRSVMNKIEFLGNSGKWEKNNKESEAYATLHPQHYTRNFANRPFIRLPKTAI